MAIFIKLFVVVQLLVIAWRWDVNGLGGVVWFVGLIILHILRTPFVNMTKANIVVESYESKVERVLMFSLWLGMFLIPVVQLITGVLAFSQYDLPFWMVLLGVVCFTSGIWLFWRSHIDLGKNWSVTLELHEDHSLITSGVYKKVRHPMYSSIWLIALSQPLLIHNWIAGFATIIIFSITCLIRLPIEEKMMYEKFGTAYEKYCRKTGRLIPRF